MPDRANVGIGSAEPGLGDNFEREIDTQDSIPGPPSHADRYTIFLRQSYNDQEIHCDDIDLTFN